MNDLLPHFIIGGAPKCGTTSVYEWMRMHPQICASSVKETMFLVDSERHGAASVHRDGLSGYDQYFQHCKSGQVRMEASPQYIHQQTPLQVIPQMETRPKVLFILRDPAKRIYSSFRFEKYSQHTVAQDVSFEEYLETERGKFVVEMTRYVKFLREWKATFGDDQLKVWVFEHMISDPRSYMTELSTWLGIDPEHWNTFDFSAKNETRNIGNMAVHKRAMRWRSLLPEGLVKQLKPMYYRLNGRPIPQKTEDVDAIMASLRNEFQELNEQLAKELNLDLTPWGVKETA